MKWLAISINLLGLILSFTSYAVDFNKVAEGYVRCFESEIDRNRDKVIVEDISQKCQKRVQESLKSPLNEIKFIAGIVESGYKSSIAKLEWSVKHRDRSTSGTIFFNSICIEANKTPLETKQSSREILDMAIASPNITMEDLECEMEVPQMGGPGKIMIENFGFKKTKNGCERICDEGMILERSFGETIGSGFAECVTCAESYSRDRGVVNHYFGNTPYSAKADSKPEEIYFHTNEKSNSCLDAKGCRDFEEFLVDKCVLKCGSMQQRNPGTGQCEKNAKYCEDIYAELLKEADVYTLRPSRMPLKSGVCSQPQLKQWRDQLYQQARSNIFEQKTDCLRNPAGHIPYGPNWDYFISSYALSSGLAEQLKVQCGEEIRRDMFDILNMTGIPFGFSVPSSR